MTMLMTWLERAPLTLRFAAVASIFALAVAGLSLKADDVEAAAYTARVSKVKGKAFYRVSAGQWQKLKKNAKLGEGSTVRTESGARLEIRLADGSVFRLGPKAELSLDSLKAGSSRTPRRIEASVKAGEVWSSVQKAMGGGGSFTVKSSHAVAGVRGTRFLTASSKSETSVKVFSGKVLVSNKPIYQVEGATKGTRVQVAGPQEVSKKEWMELVAGAMEFIKVSSGGGMTQPTAFAANKSDEFIEWNLALDAEQGFKE